MAVGRVSKDVGIVRRKTAGALLKSKTIKESEDWGEIRVHHLQQLIEYELFEPWRLGV